MFTIDLEMEDGPILAVLQALHDQVGDMAPAMNEIGMELEGRISARFEVERDPAGQPWAPWADSTVKRYPKAGNKRILDRTGEMLRSLNHQADRNSVTIGFGKDYAIYHEYGTDTMKRRGLLTIDPVARLLSPEDEHTVVAILNRHLQAALP